MPDAIRLHREDQGVRYDPAAFMLGACADPALRAALADPELKSKWLAAGIAPSPVSNPETMRHLIETGFENSRRLTDELRISAK